MRVSVAAATMLLLSFSSTALAAPFASPGQPGCQAPCAVVPIAEGCQSVSTGCSTCGPVAGCQTGCQTGCMPECGVCNGTAMCWDCSFEEGIDIDSLTPAAQSKKLFEESMARIKFELPDNAGISLLDQKMSTPGEKRSFVIPVPDATKDYTYEIKVDVVRGGKKYFKRIKIPAFRAGMILLVKVDAPPVADGEPAVIEAAVAEEAAGGKPADEGAAPAEVK